MAVPQPFIYTKPAITINSTDSICHFTQIAVLADHEKVDVSTYCNPRGTAPGAVKWTMRLRGRMTYGTDSAWTFFNALTGTAANFVVKPATGTTTNDNPAASFQAYIPQINFIGEHEVGQSAPFELECDVIGAPVVATS
jgi:hypothetical protein